MQNQNSQSNQPKGFFGKGLNAFGKLKDSITGETHKQAAKETADLKKYLDFGTQNGIIGDKESAIVVEKINLLEAKMPENKQDGINTLQSLAGKGRDMFAKAKSFDFKDISNRAKALGTAAFITTLGIFGNPAFAAKTPTSPAHQFDAVNVENTVTHIPEINSEKDAMDYDGTIKKGMTVSINGRKVKIVGDGKAQIDGNPVNLVQSYNFAIKNLPKVAPDLKPKVDLASVKKESIKVVPPNTQKVVPADVFDLPETKPKRTLWDRIRYPNGKPPQAPEIVTPIQPAVETIKVLPKVNVPDVIPVVVPKTPEKITPKVSPVQKPSSEIKKDSVIFTPPPTESKPSSVVAPKIEPSVFPLPNSKVEDPFKITPPSKTVNPLDSILTPEKETETPVIVVPDISHPTKPVELPSIQKPNPNPNIPFVKPPAPPSPDLNNYKPRNPDIITNPTIVSPDTTPKVTTPADNTRERLDIIRSGDIKPGEFFQRGEVRDAQLILDGVNAGRPRSMPTPDRKQGVLGGVRENGKELFVEGNVGFSFGEPPAEAASRSTRAQNLKKFIAETERLNAELAAELKKQKAENLIPIVQTAPATTTLPSIKPVDTSSAIK
jgi:hypothetical protein